MSLNWDLVSFSPDYVLIGALQSTIRLSPSPACFSTLHASCRLSCQTPVGLPCGLDFNGGAPRLLMLDSQDVQRLLPVFNDGLEPPTPSVSGRCSNLLS